MDVECCIDAFGTVTPKILILNEISSFLNPWNLYLRHRWRHKEKISWTFIVCLLKKLKHPFYLFSLKDYLINLSISSHYSLISLNLIWVSVSLNLVKLKRDILSYFLNHIITFISIKSERLKCFISILIIMIYLVHFDVFLFHIPLISMLSFSINIKITLREEWAPSRRL